MSKILIFIRTFWKSLTNPSYYKDILSAKFSFSLKYLFSLLLITSLAFGIVTSIRIIKLIPQVPGFIDSTKKFLTEIYPKELKITLKDKKIKTNVKEPYYIDFPQNKNFTGAAFKHFVVIDTKGEVESYPKLESMFLLTSDALVTSSGGRSYETIPLTDFFAKAPDGTSIDQKGYEAILNGSIPYFSKIIPNILKIVVMVMIVVYPVFRAAAGLLVEMTLLLPISFVLFLFAKLAKRSISYAKSYQFSMHGLTIPILLSFLFGFYSFYTWGVLLTWVAFFTFMITVILRFDKNQSL